MIVNPQKIIIVDFRIDEVKISLYKPSEKSNNVYRFTKRDDILNMYGFEEWEASSSGVCIDISLNAMSDLRTEINIQARQCSGVFQKSYQVSKANTHMSSVLSTLSALLEGIKKNSETIDIPFKSMVYTGYEFGWNSFCGLLLRVVREYCDQYDVISQEEEKIVLRRTRMDGDDVYSKYDTLLTFTPFKKPEEGNCVRFEATKSYGRIRTVGDMNSCLEIMDFTNKLIMRFFSQIQWKIKDAEKELRKASSWKLGRTIETKKIDVEKKEEELRKLKVSIH